MNRPYARLISVAAALALACGLVPFNVFAAPPNPPFNECPAVGLSPSCGSLLVINPDRSVSVYTDPSVSPFDGVEDTLIGIRNDSAQAVSAITAYGPPGIFGFDGDGLCNTFPLLSGCPFGLTGYEGPHVAFVLDPTNSGDGEIDFAGAGILPGGSSFFSLEGAITAATLKVIVGRLSFCTQAGQMQSQASVSSNNWSLNYGISTCEGLVVSHVALGTRLMAERMSVPYLDLMTCTSSTVISNCTNVITRHITLRMDEVEAQSDPTAYTRVHLLGPATQTPISAPKTSPCQGKNHKACEYLAIGATYRVDLTPAPTSGDPSTFVDVIQRYEFYTPFDEGKLQDIACEPSKSAPFPVGFIATPFPDCGRWKPLVQYSFHDTSGSTLLVSLNAAARLHFTPNALAVRASTFIRDCDSTGPSTSCDITGHAEVFPPDSPETAMKLESIVRGLYADPTGTSTKPGRYDNVHQTPSSFVLPPVPIPPGCPECVHVHWRWGDNLGAPPFFGSGQPLIGDGEPAAVPNPASHQQLDVAMVAYHSDELAPANYTQLVQGSHPAQLQMTRSSDYRFAGFTRGYETPEYPPGSCADRADLTSWGQCGQVLWLSATSYTNSAHDEDSDVFFAFGGFFCEACGSATDVSSFVFGLTPTYNGNKHHPQTFAVGSTMTISFSFLLQDVEVNDVLPPGLTGVTGSMVFVDPSGRPISGIPPVPCSVATDPSGRQVVTCHTPTEPPATFVNATITGTIGNVTPGTYSNTIRAVWGSSQDNLGPGGNYKNTDDITITP